MKRIALLILFMLAGVQSVVGGEVIHITTGEYPPWTSEKLKHGGFTNHIIIEAFALEGYTVEFTFYPWKRAYDTAKKGEKFHATSYWYPSERRVEDFIYSDPLQEDAIVFFHLKNNPLADWHTLDDLRGSIEKSMSLPHNRFSRKTASCGFLASGDKFRQNGIVIDADMDFSIEPRRRDRGD